MSFPPRLTKDKEELYEDEKKASIGATRRATTKRDLLGGYGMRSESEVVAQRLEELAPKLRLNQEPVVAADQDQPTAAAADTNNDEQSSLPPSEANLNTIPTHARIFTHTFRWAHPDAKLSGVPAAPAPWSISTADFAAAFGKRPDGSDVYDTSKPLFIRRVQVTDYHKTTAAPLGLVLSGIQGQTLLREHRNDGTGCTFAMISGAGYVPKVGQTVYELNENPRKLALHGQVNLSSEIDQFLMPAGESFMYVPVASKSGSLCASDRFKARLAPKDSRGRPIGPGIVHIQPSMQNYYMVDTNEGMATLKSYAEKVLNRRPFTDIAQHTSSLIRWDHSAMSASPAPFYSMANVGGSTRELEKSALDLQTCTVKVRYEILDQKALGITSTDAQ